MFEESLTWPFAFNEKNEMVEPQEAKSGQTYYYEWGSNQVKLCFKNCVKKTPHFAVIPDPTGTSHSFTGMSAWHIYWQSFALKTYREVKSDDKRADIKTPEGLVIEIQTSSISPIEVDARNHHHKNIIWLLDARGLSFDSESTNPLNLQFKMRDFKLSSIAGGGPFRAKPCNLFLDLGCRDYVLEVKSFDYENDYMIGNLMKMIDFLKLYYNHALVLEAEIVKLLNMRQSRSEKMIKKAQNYQREIENHLKMYEKKNICRLTATLIHRYFENTIEKGERMMQHMILKEIPPGSFFYKGKQIQIRLSNLLEQGREKHKKYVLFADNCYSIQKKIQISDKNISSCFTDPKLLEFKQKKHKEMTEIKQKYNFSSDFESNSEPSITGVDYYSRPYTLDAMKTLEGQLSEMVKLETKYQIPDYEQLKHDYDIFCKNFKGKCPKCNSSVLPGLVEVCVRCDYDTFAKQWNSLQDKVWTSQKNLEENGTGPKLKDTQERMKFIMDTKEKQGKNWRTNAPSVPFLLSFEDFKIGNFKPLKELNERLADLEKSETEKGIHNFVRLDKEMKMFEEIQAILIKEKKDKENDQKQRALLCHGAIDKFAASMNGYLSRYLQTQTSPDRKRKRDDES